MRPSLILLSFCCVLGLAPFGDARAADAYYHLPASSLKLTEGAWPAATDAFRWRRWQMAAVVNAYAVLDGEGEAYVSADTNEPWREESPVEQVIAIRAPAGREVTGRLMVPRGDFSGMVQLRFQVPLNAARPEAQAQFLQVKEDHYRLLLERGLPGGAWFRHQAREAREARGATSAPGVSPPPRFPTNPDTELERTFDLFTGGRAISENLQLDRALPAVGTGTDTVAVASLPGISVQGLDWKPLLAAQPPTLDPLASSIPADQHAVFFPSFASMTRLLDEAETNGTPVLQLLEPRAEDANARGRYQEQLCLGLTEFSRVLGPFVITSVAFTGSDPFLRVGTDVAVLFEAKNPALLQAHLAAQQAAARTTHAGTETVTGEIAGVKLSGVVAPDRSVCSYVLAVSNRVIVSNSRAQLTNLVQATQGALPALAGQDEYRYFRQKYPRADAAETALLVLTDATIRRWCGPQWRIADSRRTRAAAVMAELQAAHLDELAAGRSVDSGLTAPAEFWDAGALRWTKAGVSSGRYGTLEFMTPILELGLTEVTRAEAEAYARWRENYQRNWRQFFDPIAVRFSVAPERLGAELTVMPLIAASDYGRFLNYTLGAKLEPGSGDPHTNALARLALALNTQSEGLRSAGSFLGTMAPGLRTNPLGWVGSCLSLYADEDPVWDRLLALTNTTETSEFVEKHWNLLPVALHVEVKNPLGVVAFLTALRAFSEQAAPGMAQWQNLEHNGSAYVKITAAQRSGTAGQPEWSLYYAVSPRGLTVTINEALVKRVLDRQSATNETAGVGVPTWLGSNLGLMARRRFFDVLLASGRAEYEMRLQSLAWGNLPVLNEWRRRYPDQDPVRLHEACWGTRLLCPAGGSYVWNEAWQTMESTVCGHPGQPKPIPAAPLAGVSFGNLGVSFEHQGLSAHAVLERQPVP